jgi:peptide chain release factor 1
VVTCQVERSQLKNRERALSVLRSKLWEIEKEKQFGDIDDARRSQVGTAKRCEKIRTYNFPQDRITDHRINQNWHGIPKILAGGLEPIISSLIGEDRKRLLENQEDE